MTTWTDDNGDVVATDTFTSSCPDCGDPIEVVDGQSAPHDCDMPERHRGRVGQAWADGEQWVLEHPEQYNLRAADPREALADGADTLRSTSDTFLRLAEWCVTQAERLEAAAIGVHDFVTDPESGDCGACALAAEHPCHDAA